MGHLTQSAQAAAAANPSAPPPYFEHAMENGENQPLLGVRTLSESSEVRFDPSTVKVGMATFWSVFSGICFGGCRLLLQNIPMSVTELTMVGGLIYIIIAGLFVTACQCSRLWPNQADNRAKLFLVLYAFLSGIMFLCSIEVFDMLNIFDAEFVTCCLLVTTPILSLIILKEPLRLWKLTFVPVIILAMLVIIRPPLIFNNHMLLLGKEQVHLSSSNINIDVTQSLISG